MNCNRADQLGGRTVGVEPTVRFHVVVVFGSVLELSIFQDWTFAISNKRARRCRGNAAATPRASLVFIPQNFGDFSISQFSENSTFFLIFLCFSAGSS